MIRLSAKDGPRALRAAVLAMRYANKDIKRDVNQKMRETMNPVWRQLISQNLGGASLADDMALSGARIRAGNPPALIAGNSKRRYGRALVPTRDWHLVEYGMRPRLVEYERRSKHGGTHKVTRTIGTGWPNRSREGRILGPATREILPRITAFFIQSVKRAYIEALEDAANG